MTAKKKSKTSSSKKKSAKKKKPAPKKKVKAKKKKAKPKQAIPDTPPPDVSGRTNPARVALYLPPDERALWQQAVALSGKYDSFSGMARDLVKKYHAAMMKKVGDECPS
jgi:hypothetical protein